MKPLKFVLSANSQNTEAIGASDTIDARVLGAGVEEIHTVPAGAKVVVFGATASFYVRMDGTVAVPAADVTDGTAGELNPSARSVRGVTSIHLVAPADGIVTMSFFS